MARKDEKAAAEAARLHKQYTDVTARLQQQGKTKAVENIDKNAGRYDSPEVRQNDVGR